MSTPLTDISIRGKKGDSPWIANWQALCDIVEARLAALEAVNQAQGATSISNLANSVAVKTFDLQEADHFAAFAIGDEVEIDRFGDDTVKMMGEVTALAAPNHVTINVTLSTGAGGPFNNWVLKPVVPSVLPVQAGNGNGVLGTDGSVASWRGTFTAAAKTGAHTAFKADIGGAWIYTDAGPCTLDASANLGAKWYLLVQAGSVALPIALTGGDQIGAQGGADAASLTLAAGDAALICCTGAAGAGAFKAILFKKSRSGVDTITATVTLTSGSAPRQIVKMTRFDQVITMEDATKLNKGDSIEFVNKNGFPARIVNHQTGATIGFTVPGKTTKFTVDDIASQDGVWSHTCGDIAADNGFEGFGQGFWTGSPTSGVVPQGVMLSAGATLAGIMVFYNSGGPSLQARGFLIDGVKMKLTPVVNVLGSGAFSGFRVKPSGAAEVAVMYATNGPGNISAATVDFDTVGLTLTVNAAATLGNYGTSLQWVDMDLSGASLVALWQKDSGTIQINGGTIAAGVITPGAAQTFDPGINASQGLIVIPAAGVAYSMYIGNSNDLRRARHTFAGAAVTPGTVTSLASRKNLIGGFKMAGQAGAFAMYEDGTGGAGGSLYGATMIETGVGGGVTFTETALETGTSGATGPGHMGVIQSSSGNAFLIEPGDSGKLQAVQIKFTANVPALGVRFDLDLPEAQPGQAIRALDLVGDYGIFGYSAQQPTGGTSYTSHFRPVALAA